MDLRAAAAVAVGAGAVEAGSWLHQLAGPAGDIGVIVAGAVAVGAVVRWVARGTRAAWGDVRDVKAATEMVPAFVEEQRETNRAMTEALEDLKERSDSHERMLGVLASVDRIEMKDALRRFRPPAA